MFDEKERQSEKDMQTEVLSSFKCMMRDDLKDVNQLLSYAKKYAHETTAVANAKYFVSEATLRLSHFKDVFQKFMYHVKENGCDDSKFKLTLEDYCDWYNSLMHKKDCLQKLISN